MMRLLHLGRVHTRASLTHVLGRTRVDGLVWTEKKNPTRVEKFKPGNHRFQPGVDPGPTHIEQKVWTEIADYDPRYQKWETWSAAEIGLKESTPLNKLAVADAAWARMPVDSLNMTLA